MLGWFFREHIPRENVGAFEAGEPQSAIGRVKAVMLVFAVAVKDKAGRARLIVQLDGDGQIEGQPRRLGGGDQQRPTAEAGAESIDNDAASPLLPASAEEGFPL